MSKSLLAEIEAKMEAFFTNATDEEFWATLRSIDEKGFTKIDLPLVELHEKQARSMTFYDLEPLDLLGSFQVEDLKTRQSKLLNSRRNEDYHQSNIDLAFLASSKVGSIGVAWAA